MEKKNMKQILCICISNILNRENKEYANLQEIYEEVANYLEEENNESLQSQIRGRLQECCEQYSSFLGEPLFLTEKVRSGKWTLKPVENKYVRYVHNSFLVTSDNWLHVEKVNQITEEYTSETNADNVYRAKLTQVLGQEKSKIIINELDRIRYLLKAMKNVEKMNDGYGTAFEVFAISVIYNIEYEECINKYIIHGDSDGLIDAIYYGDSKEVCIYQIKLGAIGDNVYDEMKKNYRSCLLKKEIPENGKDLYNFIEKKKAFFQNKREVYKTISESSCRDTNLKPQDIYQLFFKNKMLPISNNYLTLHIAKPENPLEKSQYNVSTDGNNNFNFYIKAEDLIKNLLEALGIDSLHYNRETVDLSKYFSDNVRGFLSSNKNMLATIEAEPENFVKYNNGISITGEVTDLGSQIQIENPVINNGQQTITTLIKTDMNLEKIVIPVKITNETNMVIKGKISQYTNEQVKVKPIDMLSLNNFVREVQEEIWNSEYRGENYFLKIYSSGKKSCDELIAYLYKRNNVIELLDFVKLYFSLENKKDLGLWKNSPSYQLENTIVNKSFNLSKSFKVCEAISRFKNYLELIDNKKEKDDLKSADLAFKYLICQANLTDDEAFTIIKNINDKYYYQLKDEKSKLIDVYKSTTIINKLEDMLDEYKKTKINN